MKKILIISPAYPPYGGVGSKRMNSLSRYLCNKGKKITVIRNNSKSWPEEMIKEEVPSKINIIDVFIDEDDSFYDSEKKYMETLSKLLVDNNYDIAIYSGGPFYTFKVAASIKKKFGLKYIIEFRDLWIFNDRLNCNLSTKIKRSIQNMVTRPIEKDAIRNAEKVVFVSNKDKICMMNHYTKYKDKFVVIHNGYDCRLENIKLNSISIHNGFVIGVFGKFSYYSPRLTKEFFKAINNLNKEGYNINLFHIGNKEPIIENIITELSFDKERYICTGYMDYFDGIKALQSVSCFLLIEDKPTGLGTKVYDYIYLNKPIVGVMNDGSEFKELLQSFENFYLCSNNQEIYILIKKLINNKIRYLDSNLKVRNYSRLIHNEIYYKLIRDITYLNTGRENL